MQKDYRLCLEKLARDPPRRKAAIIRSLLPGIEAALHSGQSLKDIWEALGNEGLQMTYHVFHMTVWRARKTRSHLINAPTSWKRWDLQPETVETQPNHHFPPIPIVQVLWHSCHETIYEISSRNLTA